MKHLIFSYDGNDLSISYLNYRTLCLCIKGEEDGEADRKQANESFKSTI